MPRGGIPTWTRESAIEAVQAFHKRHGYQPVCREAGRFNQLPSWGVAKRLFGDWNEMVSTLTGRRQRAA